MPQRLHLVFGGELVDPSSTQVRDRSQNDLAEIYPDHASAYDAWTARAQATVDDAHLRCFIAHPHRLFDEEAPASPTEELD